MTPDELSERLLNFSVRYRDRKPVWDKAGLEVLVAREETAEEQGRPVTFLWLIATRPVVAQPRA